MQTNDRIRKTYRLPELNAAHSTGMMLFRTGGKREYKVTIHLTTDIGQFALAMTAQEAHQLSYELNTYANAVNRHQEIMESTK